MSKLSFRARQLDAYKAMPVYRSEEIPEVTDVAAINRAVPQMPTGMEKEEETEHHLQRALSAQQVYGTSEALVIPVPETDDAKKQYEQIYSTDYKPPKQYIHAQSLGVDQEIPDYDIDSEDEAWLENQSKKMEITHKIFEEMIDRLEKGSGQQIVELKDAKVLLKEDDDLIITVYDYWLNKRLNYTPHSLIPTVKSEKRDGSTTNNPYVAFRRRTEKMQTRKNRKNDEVSYEKMLKLRRDLQRAVTVLEMIKKREKCKKELLQLTIEILDKRYDMEDFSGSNLSHAESQKTPRSVFYPLYQDQCSKDPSDAANRKHKRKYEKKKHKSGGSQFHGDVDVLEYVSTEDEPLSPGISMSDQEDELHPDGPFAFRRKRFCSYHAPLDFASNWEQNGGHADKKYRYTLTSIDTGPESRRCLGYARRRRGRGGRIILDRAHVEQRADFYDRLLEASVPSCSVSSEQVEKRLEETKDNISTDDRSIGEPTFQDFISENKWLHFTAATDVDYDSPSMLFNGQLEMSSDSDLSDPIIDIIPEIPSSSLPQGFTPIVTATPSAPLLEPTCPLVPTAPVPTTESTVITPNGGTENSDSLTPNPTPTPSSIKSNALDDPEIHQRQIQALKTQPAHPVSNSKLTTSTALNHKERTSNSVSTHNTTITTQHVTVNANHHNSASVNHVVDAAKTTYAVTALVNGQSAGRGNGIKQINGPTSKVDLKHKEILSTGSMTVNSVRKLNYPLTPSSDTSETAAEIVKISSIPGESGDSITSRQILVSDKNFTDSAGLNAIPDVASTMEVS